MKKKIKIIISIFVIFFSLQLKLNSIENKILVKVENEIITSLDILNEIKFLKALNPQIRNIENQQMLNIAKNNLIKEKVKKIELLKNFKDINVDEGYLTQVIKSSYEKFNINNFEELKKYLFNFDVNIKNVKEKISIEIIWNQLIFNKYSSKIKINKEDLKSEILKNQKSEKKSYLLSEILFEVDDKSKLNEKFKIIEDSIQKNGFENTALSYSISDSSNLSGNIGWVDENIFNNKIKDQLSGLKIKQYTDPILTPSGFLILKINDIKSVKTEISINEELEKLIRIKTNEQLNQFSNIYFNKIKKDLLIK